MFVFMFLCSVVLCKSRPLRRADRLSKGVLPSVLIRIRNLRCEAAKVFTRTVNSLIMMTMLYHKYKIYDEMLYIWQHTSVWQPCRGARFRTTNIRHIIYI
jgi:hypothetical protein